MLDPKRLRNDLDAVIAGVARRGFAFDRDRFESLEAQRKELQVTTQNLQNERNSKSKGIGKAKAAGEDIQPLLDAVASLGDELRDAQEKLAEVQQELQQMLLEIPNIPDVSVPDGKVEEDNREERRWGTLRGFDFEPKDHVDLGTARGLFDSETAAKITGSRFTLLSGPLARLHRALTQFMLDIHVSEHGYTETYVPYLVNGDSLYGTGQLPKFEEDLFKLQGEFPYYLIPTAEVPVTNILRDEIVDDDRMPCRYVAHTPCFRSEAGSYGKDVRGLIRQHQFNKVELVKFTRPEDSDAELASLLADAEGILQALELPYRVVDLCSADIGFSAARTFDIEVWLPGQQAYREISSCSNFRDFQARRAGIRFRREAGSKPEFVHTLNGSGLAVGRTLVAVLENYQQEDGSVVVPQALRAYMGGLEKIG